MKVGKTFTYNSGQEIESNIRRIEQDLTQLFTLSQGRIRFGNGITTERGENISGEFRTIVTTTADTEVTVPHTLGSVPIGYLVINIDKGGVIYDSGTAWTKTNIYIKCSSADTTAKVFLIK